MTALHLRGHVLPSGEERDVYVVDGHLTFAEPEGGATTVFDGGWLTPGLVDAHAHLALNSPTGDGAPPDERVRASAEAQLRAGVLLVREPGSPGYESFALDGQDDLPRVITAGRFIAPHGRYFPGLAREIDASDVAAAVAEEAAASGAWVKVIGDFFEPGGVLEPNWTPAQLRTAADTAHAAGARITIHATCKTALADAVDAGFDCIEHGTSISRELIDAMAERNVTFVPTMSITDALRSVLTILHEEEYGRVVRCLDEQPALVAFAAERGVRLLAGTDAGMVAHGVVAGEIAKLLDAGVAPDVALGAGSWAARDYLGERGIEEGAHADIVAFADDPRTDGAVLTRPDLIMRAGRVIA